MPNPSPAFSRNSPRDEAPTVFSHSPDHVSLGFISNAQSIYRNSFMFSNTRHSLANSESPAFKKEIAFSFSSGERSRLRTSCQAPRTQAFRSPGCACWTRRQVAGLLLHELAVQQCKSLGRHSCDIPARTTHSRVRLVENSEHGERKRPLHIKVDATPVVLRRAERYWPLARRPHHRSLLLGKGWNHRPAAHLQIEHSGRLQHGVAQNFGVHALAVHSPEILIGGIDTGIAVVWLTGHAIGVREHDYPL